MSIHCFITCQCVFISSGFTGCFTAGFTQTSINREWFCFLSNPIFFAYIITIDTFWLFLFLSHFHILSRLMQNLIITCSLIFYRIKRGLGAERGGTHPNSTEAALN